MKKYISNIMAILFMPIVVPTACIGIAMLVIASLPVRLIPLIDEKDIWAINKIYKKINSVIH